MSSSSTSMSDIRASRLRSTNVYSRFDPMGLAVQGVRGEIEFVRAPELVNEI